MLGRINHPLVGFALDRTKSSSLSSLSSSSWNHHHCHHHHEIIITVVIMTKSWSLTKSSLDHHHEIIITTICITINTIIIMTLADRWLFSALAGFVLLCASCIMIFFTAGLKKLWNPASLHLERGEHAEYGKDRKHQPEELKHYIHDSKHSIHDSK